jgi:hypothetical protein
MMRAVLLLIFSLALNGCAALMSPLPEDTYTWHKTGDELPMVEQVVPQQAVQAYCSQTSRFVMACSVRTESECFVFASSKSLMEMMRPHETRHCDGWDHQLI